MSKKILEIEGLYESCGIDAGYLGHTFTINESSLADAMRAALGVHDNSDIVSAGDYKDSPAADTRKSTLKVRVTVEVLEGEVS